MAPRSHPRRRPASSQPFLLPHLAPCLGHPFPVDHFLTLQGPAPGELSGQSPSLPQALLFLVHSNIYPNPVQFSVHPSLSTPDRDFFKGREPDLVTLAAELPAQGQAQDNSKNEDV